MILKIAPLVWCGMILGVSFLATPAKFLAADLPLGTALDIGRHTFGVFLKVEVFFALTLLTGLIVGRKWLSNKSMLLVVIPIVLLAIQYFWIIDILNLRVLMIIQGDLLPPSHAHKAYAACESIKILCLFSLPFTISSQT